MYVQLKFKYYMKIPACGRHQISQPMRIEAPIYIIRRKKLLILRLYESVHKCTNPPVEHLPRVDHQWVQSGTTPCFQGSTSRSMSAPIHQSNTSHAWTIPVCNAEQLLIFRALPVGRRVHQSTSQRPSTRHECNL